MHCPAVSVNCASEIKSRNLSVMAGSNRSSKFEFDERLYNMQMEVLNENRDFLCKTITPSRHYPYLRQQQVLSLEGQETIESQVTGKDKVNKLIDELEKNGGPKAYLAFMEALLNEKTQEFVIKKLNMALEEKRNRPDVRDAIHRSESCREPTEDDDIDTIISEESLEPERPPFNPSKPPSFEVLSNLTTKGSSESQVNGHKLIPHGKSQEDN
ncbi:uncharacterized protein [Amphiura filiformis]|uniref:uncharacterized protein n=1 Tax=Amphiura filiformis TaxID=82378 RepID=UPI003B21167D